MKKLSGFFFALAVFSILGLLVSTPTHSATFCVGSASELQSALTTATSNGQNDVIRVNQGTYNGNFIYASTEPYGVTIEGGYFTGCSSRVVDPANTVLDAEESGLVLAFSAPGVAADFVVDGVTLQNGNYENRGGGLYVNTSSGELNLLHSTIHNNSDGGFYLQAGTVNISNSIISSNHSVSLDGQVILADEVNVSDSLINNNYSQNDAGGLTINSATITLRRNTITENISDNGDGGGLYLGGGTIELSNNKISHNFSNGRAGGGVWANGHINAINNIIEFNQAKNEGGGIKCIGEAFLQDNIIRYNDSEGGGGVDLIISGRANLINNIINGNTASGIGGGVWFYALHLSAPPSTLTNNTIISNNSPKGGGIYLVFEEDECKANIYNNVIMSNGFDVGKDIYIRNDGNGNFFPSTVNLFNNDFDKSTEGTYIQLPFTIDPSNLNNVDPLFVDSENDDYHLTGSSPCIDVGSNSVSNEIRDIEGNRRFMDGDQNGTVMVDIGAYEFGNSNQCTGHFDQNGDVDGSDLSLFGAELYQGGCNKESQCIGDYNADGFVDSGDFNVFVSYFGQSGCLLP